MMEKTTNGDMPAMPQDDAMWCQRIGECPTLATGLTKREMMAMHMMAANRARGTNYQSWELMAADAVEASDALLAELDRKTQNQPPATAE